MSVLSHPSPGILKISLSAIVENYRILKSMTLASVAPVLKADAYGLGAAEVFNALRAEGIKQVFVATPDEAAELRTIDSKIGIFVLGGFYAGADDFYAAHTAIPILNSLAEIDRWQKQMPGHAAGLHFDTGMNRLGLGPDETEKLLADPSILDGLDLRLVMSHFACSDEKDHEMNRQQAAAFDSIADTFPDIPKSLCNSAGIFRDQNWHYDLLRPGFALYGGNPTPEVTNPMRRVVDLSVRILQTRCVKAGESVGYGATYTFQNDTSLATVALGYADGFHRAGGNRAKFYWNGQPCPIVGRVSMDLIIVDTGTVTGPKPQAGDLMEVLGPHQSIDDLARDCGTIGYEIITNLGRRYERAYI